MAAFEELPEGCIAAVLSRTTPVDACRLSLISKTFLSAANSDAVWNRFLPSDSQFIDSIISQSPSLANIPTKKALYLALSDLPIIIDHGQKSFQLDRKSGKNCCMLSARSLTIHHGDHGLFWKWIEMSESRFYKVAKLCIVNWLEIRGTINTLALSPNTQYSAYLVFKMIDAFGFDNHPVYLSVGVKDGQRSTKIVCLDLDPKLKHWSSISELYLHRLYRTTPSYHRVAGLQRPSVRSDGWLEIEMGEFSNLSLEDQELQMSVIELKGGGPMGNFFLEGIELRPKEDN